MVGISGAQAIPWIRPSQGKTATFTALHCPRPTLAKGHPEQTPATSSSLHGQVNVVTPLNSHGYRLLESKEQQTSGQDPVKSQEHLRDSDID